MDLHIIPGVKAKDVAEAHQLDLLVEKKYGCTCMTYWIDESRNSVFCLIDAPNENAVRELHNSSHGLSPHKIIPVNETVVQSFLGRIFDPQIDGLPEGELKVFNDPSFRTLVLLDAVDPLLLENKEELFRRFSELVREKSEEYTGEIARHSEEVRNILSFTSPQNALRFAVALKEAFSEDERKELRLKISLNGGVPVAQSKRLFGDTIDQARNLLFVKHDQIITITTAVKNILSHEIYDEYKKTIQILNPTEEKKLSRLFVTIEKNLAREEFGVDDLCRELGQSKSNLNRMIQSLTGRSPSILIKEYRLRKALYLLRQESIPVSQIAFTTGFGSPSYFSKCFKEHFGLSPSQFLQNLR